MAALVSGLLRTLAPRRRRPAELLKALNDALIERKVEARYVTLWCCCGTRPRGSS